MSLPSGHNYGCHHNPEEVTSSYFSYGHGHLIERGSASTGYRTILAYNAAGHSTRVNYYSNPSVVYPVSQTATGVVDLSDNARVITQNRFAFASLGDESAICTDGYSTMASSSSSSSTQPPPTTPAPSPQSCGNCTFPFIHGGRVHDRCTTYDGKAPWCSTSVDSSGYHVSAWEYCTDSACPGMAPNPTEVIQPHPQNEGTSCCKYINIFEYYL